jgi:hypothetical protein
MEIVRPLICSVALWALPTASVAATNFNLPGVGSEGRLTLLSNNPVGEGKLCIAGSIFDPDETKSVAVGMVVDVKSSKIEWVRTVSPTAGNFQNRFVGCYSYGKEVRFIEETETQSSATLRQVLINMVQLGSSTGPRRTALWETGKSNWLVALNSTPEQTFVVFGHAPADEGGEAQMSLHYLGEARKITKVQHGSFQRGSVAVKHGDGIQIAGRFSKSGFEMDATPAAASLSKTGNYAWSKLIDGQAIYGKSSNQQSITTAILSQANGNLRLLPLTQTAAVERALQSPSADCKPIAMFADQAIAYQACQPASITFQYTDGRPNKIVAGSLPDVAPGPTALVVYAKTAAGKIGYRLEILSP